MFIQRFYNIPVDVSITAVGTVDGNGVDDTVISLVYISHSIENNYFTRNYKKIKSICMKNVYMQLAY